MPKVIPSGMKEQEEEEEEEAASSLHPRGLHSRGPTVLPKVEPAGQSTVTEGAVVAE